MMIQIISMVYLFSEQIIKIKDNLLRQIFNFDKS